MTQPSMRHDDLDPAVNELAAHVVDAVHAVRKELGAGLREGVYVEALTLELRDRGLLVDREVRVPMSYKGRPLGGDLRVDLCVEGRLVVEAKAVEAFSDHHAAQVLTYMRLGGYPIGLLVNFNAVPLRHGIRRFVQTRQEGR